MVNGNLLRRRIQGGEANAARALLVGFMPTVVPATMVVAAAALILYLSVPHSHFHLYPNQSATHKIKT